jgi:hypothetical protein
MMTQTFSVEEAIEILDKTISNRTRGKEDILELCKWISNWNNELENSMKILCYFREGRNISFTQLNEVNKNKSKNNNFLVIKYPGSDVIDLRDYLHLNFYLGKRGYGNYYKVIIQRKKLPSRWCIKAEDLFQLNITELNDIAKFAYNKRF